MELCREMLLTDQYLCFPAVCFSAVMDEFGLSDERGVWELPFKQRRTMSAETDPFISIH